MIGWGGKEIYVEWNQKMVANSSDQDTLIWQYTSSQADERLFGMLPEIVEDCDYCIKQYIPSCHLHDSPPPISISFL